jgi:uncharacterized repeat protein (TIGR03847 family)
MSRRIYSFDRPDRFVCGAVGRPGQRTFFLQASKGSQLVSVALEKAQVAVLAERLALLLVDLRERGFETANGRRSGAETADGDPLAEPLIEAFRVGTLTLAWDPQHERVVIEARELRGPLGEPEAEDEDELADDAPDGPDVVRVQLEPTDAHAFVTRAMAVIQAGRPPCPMCGAPLDPSGHFCPRRNGYTH